MRRVLLLVVLASLVVSGCSWSGADDRPPASTKAAAAKVPRVPVMVVLDASGSMKVEDAPGQRFAAARAAVTSLAKDLAKGHRIGLLVYGTSTGSSDADKAKGCRDIRSIVPFGPIDEPTFRSKVATLEPSGYTPIGASLRRAAAELPSGEGKRAIVLVSDGIDTCSPPDPCTVAKELHEEDPDLVVHTVAFRVSDDPQARKQLSCIASVTGGLDLDAASGALLRTRLLAAFDPVRAANSLQPTGYRGLSPGMTVAQARAVAEDLDDVSSTGRVEIVYVDCALVFEDGVLTEIRPRGRAVRTLDGIGVGDPVTAAQKVYVNADQPAEVAGRTITFAADLTAGTGYRVTFRPASGSTTAEPQGTITRIIVCRCLPQVGPPQTVVRAVAADGSLQPGWKIEDLTGEEAMSFVGLSPNARNNRVFWYGSTADGTSACWIEDRRAKHVLCLQDPVDRTLVRRTVAELPSEPYTSSDGSGEPRPFMVELADGSRWRDRTGGAWGATAPGWNGSAFCVARCDDDGDVLQTSEERGPWERRRDGWYAFRGPQGDTAEDVETPRPAKIVRLWFVG